MLELGHAAARLRQPAFEIGGRGIPLAARPEKDVFRSELFRRLARPFEEPKDRAQRVLAEPSIGFPLGLVVELIAGALVRKLRIAGAILSHVARLIAGQRGLEIDEYAAVIFFPVVDDVADDCMLPRAAAFRFVRAQGIEINLDLDPEVFADAPHGVAEIIERGFRVGPAIREEDVATMAPDKFVEGRFSKCAPSERWTKREFGWLSLFRPLSVIPNISRRNSAPGTSQGRRFPADEEPRPSRKFSADIRKQTTVPRLAERSPCWN